VIGVLTGLVYAILAVVGAEGIAWVIPARYQAGFGLVPLLRSGTASGLASIMRARSHSITSAVTPTFWSP